MNAITTHVLDTVLGKPAAGIVVSLEMRVGDAWDSVGASLTDADGRCRDLTAEALAGIYRLTFETGSYFARMGRNPIYPRVSIEFVCDGLGHYHMPLLLSDHSYTTYRGS